MRRSIYHVAPQDAIAQEETALPHTEHPEETVSSRESPVIVESSDVEGVAIEVEEGQVHEEAGEVLDEAEGGVYRFTAVIL